MANSAGYTIDRNRTQTRSRRRLTRELAPAATAGWKHFDLGWTQIVPPETPILTGQTVALQAEPSGSGHLLLSHRLHH